MSSELQLRLAGLLQIALAALHLFFPRRFHWKEDLSRLSLMNRQIFVIHTVFICVVLTMFGALSAFAPGALLQPTPLSRLVLAGLASFWGLRLLFQWLVCDWRLWQGNTFNTLVQLGATAFWLYFTAVYAGILIRRG